MKLNLGASDYSVPGHLSVDRIPPADVIADLNDPWPWPDSSVSHIVAYDIFEHLSSRVHTMNELYRVLMPNAQAEIIVPSATRGAGFVQDPTHISPWCMNSFQYFEDGRETHKRFARAYGITAKFKVVQLGEQLYADVVEPVWKIYCVLETLK